MAFGFDDITFSKRELGADVNFVTSMLNWLLAVAFSSMIYIGFAPSSEAMAALLPYFVMVCASPLVLISVAAWLATKGKARKFWRPHWIPVIVMALEYVVLGLLYFSGRV